MPFTHFSADSTYPKIVFRVPDFCHYVQLHTCKKNSQERIEYLPDQLFVSKLSMKKCKQIF